MNKEEYAEKLTHPKWQRRRLEIFNRDDFTCQKCGDKETTLHVHHLIYFDCNPWDYNDGELITLCAHCHGLIENLKDAHADFDTIEVAKFKSHERKGEVMFWVAYENENDIFFENMIYSEGKISKRANLTKCIDGITRIIEYTKSIEKTFVKSFSREWYIKELELVDVKVNSNWKLSTLEKKYHENVKLPF